MTTSQLSGYWLSWGVFLSGTYSLLLCLPMSSRERCMSVSPGAGSRALQTHLLPPARALRSSVPLAPASRLNLPFPHTAFPPDNAHSAFSVFRRQGFPAVLPKLWHWGCRRAMVALGCPTPAAPQRTAPTANTASNSTPTATNQPSCSHSKTLAS